MFICHLKIRSGAGILQWNILGEYHAEENIRGEYEYIVIPFVFLHCLWPSIPRLLIKYHQPFRQLIDSGY